MAIDLGLQHINLSDVGDMIANNIMKLAELDYNNQMALNAKFEKLLTFESFENINNKQLEFANKKLSEFNKYATSELKKAGETGMNLSPIQWASLNQKKNDIMTEVARMQSNYALFSKESAEFAKNTDKYHKKSTIDNFKEFEKDPVSWVGNSFLVDSPKTAVQMGADISKMYPINASWDKDPQKRKGKIYKKQYEFNNKFSKVVNGEVVPLTGDELTKARMEAVTSYFKSNNNDYRDALMGYQDLKEIDPDMTNVIDNIAAKYFPNDANSQAAGRAAAWLLSVNQNLLTYKLDEQKSFAPKEGEGKKKEELKLGGTTPSSLNLTSARSGKTYSATGSFTSVEGTSETLKIKYPDPNIGAADFKLGGFFTDKDGNSYAVGEGYKTTMEAYTNKSNAENATATYKEDLSMAGLQGKVTMEEVKDRKGRTYYKVMYPQKVQNLSMPIDDYNRLSGQKVQGKSKRSIFGTTKKSKPQKQTPSWVVK